MKRGLSYEELAAAYEIRNGFDTPTPWKYIAGEFGISVRGLFSAIKRLERDGLNRNANGEKPNGRISAISGDMLEQIKKARHAGNTWPAIAGALRLPVATVQVSYWRWKKRSK